MHKGKPIRNLAAAAKGPMPKNIQRNQDLLRKAWRIGAENVWDTLPSEVSKIFSIGDDTEKKREEFLGSEYSNIEIGWFNLPHVTADRFAGRLISAPYGSTVWTGSISHGLHQLFSCPEVIKEDRSKIVYTGEDFSGIKQSADLFTRHINRFGASYELQQVSSKDGNRFDLEEYLSTLDEQVSLAILPHIGFMNGQRITDQDIQKVADRCRELGILFAIDGGHAIGEKFIDITKLNPDVYLSTLMKEGSGSAGSAFMYLNPNIDFNPTKTSWLSHSNPFSHQGTYMPANNVRQRFYGGTPSIATYYQCIEGARIYIEAGFEEVERDMSDKIEDAIAILQKGGVNIISPTDRENRSQLIVLTVQSNPNNIRDELFEEHGIRVYPNEISSQGTIERLIRLSPHISCPLEESNAACETIAKVIRQHS